MRSAVFYLPGFIGIVLQNITILLTVVSGIDYIIKGSRLLNGAAVQKKA